MPRKLETSAPETSSLVRRRVTAIAGLVLLPVGAVALYLTLGSPDLPGEPLAARTQTASDSSNIQNLVAKVEDHLQSNPRDGRAWEVLAPVYMRVGRFDDAARAWSNVIALNGSNAEREANHGEAIVAAANGVVTAEAKAAFDRSLALDKQDVMARFYMGMAADQDGRRAEAEKIWNDLIAGAPPNAPWIEVVRHALARNAKGSTAGIICFRSPRTLICQMAKIFLVVSSLANSATALFCIFLATDSPDSLINLLIFAIFFSRPLCFKPQAAHA